MNERDALFLAHVLSAIPDIESFTVEGRDRLIHAYFNVDLDAVWSMVEQDLPGLCLSVSRAFKSLPKR